MSKAETPRLGASGGSATADEAPDWVGFTPRRGEKESENMQRTLTTQRTAIEFDLPRDPYIPNTSSPRCCDYINHRVAALTRAYPNAERVYCTISQDRRNVIRIVLPIRHTYSRAAWRVYRTAFHGGGLISAHYTQGSAERASRLWRGDTDCICGCAGVVAPWEQPCDAERNRNLTHNPYALTD